MTALQPRPRHLTPEPVSPNWRTPEERSRDAKLLDELAAKYESDAREARARAAAIRRAR